MMAITCLMQRRYPSLKSAETVSTARYALYRKSVKITECDFPWMRANMHPLSVEFPI